VLGRDTRVQEVERQPVVALGPKLVTVHTKVEDLSVRTLRVVFHELHATYARALLDLVHELAGNPDAQRHAIQVRLTELARHPAPRADEVMLHRHDARVAGLYAQALPLDEHAIEPQLGFTVQAGVRREWEAHLDLARTVR
jgi:hypothetical protein